MESKMRAQQPALRLQSFIASAIVTPVGVFQWRLSPEHPLNAHYKMILWVLLCSSSISPTFIHIESGLLTLQTWSYTSPLFYVHFYLHCQKLRWRWCVFRKYLSMIIQLNDNPPIIYYSQHGTKFQWLKTCYLYTNTRRYHVRDTQTVSPAY